MRNSTHDTEETTMIADAAITDKAELLAYNDDYNTFDWVIKCFMEVCGHTFEQSEQLSLLVHFKGKAVVKAGTFENLKPMKDALIDRGLSAVIETFQEKS